MQKKNISNIIIVIITVFVIFQTCGIANSPPEKPSIEGKVSGKTNIEYTFSIVSTDPDGDDIGYSLCGQWGNNPCNISLGLYSSGEIINVSCEWCEPGNYTLKVCALDCYGACSDWSSFEITLSKQKSYNPYLIILKLLFEKFPIIQNFLEF